MNLTITHFWYLEWLISIEQAEASTLVSCCLGNAASIGVTLRKVPSTLAATVSSGSELKQKTTIQILPIILKHNFITKLSCNMFSKQIYGPNKIIGLPWARGER